MKRVIKLALIISGLPIITAVFFWKTGYNPFTPFFSDWKFEKTVIAAEQDTNENPGIIQLKDGCLRLYSHGTMGSGGIMSIFSYSSCDGLNWKFEGKRIERAAMPAAILIEDGKVRIYFQRGAENDTRQVLMTAISDDGLNFKINETPLLITEEGELKDVKTITHLEIIKLNRGYRMYFDEDLKPTDFERYKNEKWTWPVWRIRSLYSEDGLHWNLEPGIRIDYEQEPLKYMQRAGSSTVIKDGNLYYMYFNAGFSPWEDLKWWKRFAWSGIYEAVSKDGLNWKIIDKNIFKYGSDPKIVKMEDGIRIYISEGDRVINSIESYIRK